MAEKKAIIYYSGTVQGVGFRYRTDSIARDYNLRGWVKNLPDGRVELVVQAEEDELNEFISRVEESMSGYISGRQINFSAPESKLSAFGIKF